jgi:hypothetical protein
MYKLSAGSPVTPSTMTSATDTSSTIALTVLGQ